MAVDASANFITSFDAMVKHAFQGASKLRSTVRTKTGVVGSTHKFPIMGKGIASARTPQTDVTPMNIDHSTATATLSDWVAAEYSDVYDLSKLNFDERKELAFIVAQAMGRRLDQLILDAMDASANATQVGINVGGTNSSLTVEKILEASRRMNALGVPSGDRHFAISARSLEGALLETQIGSSDFNVVKALAMGEVNTWGGFQFHVIEDRTEGGVPLSSTTRTNFAYHRDAVGLAIGIDMRTESNYIPEKTSTLITGMFSGGAVTIDTNGVFDVLTYEA